MIVLQIFTRMKNELFLCLARPKLNIGLISVVAVVTFLKLQMDNFIILLNFYSPTLKFKILTTVTQEHWQLHTTTTVLQVSKKWTTFNLQDTYQSWCFCLHLFEKHGENLEDPFISLRQAFKDTPNLPATPYHKGRTQGKIQQLRFQDFSDDQRVVRLLEA